MALRWGLLRVSRLALIVIVLFAATVAVGIVGLGFYYSYKSVLSPLAKPMQLGSLLHRVHSIEYKVYVSPSGDTYYVSVAVNVSDNTTKITMTNPSGTAVGSVLLHFNATNITWALISFGGLNENLSGSNLTTYIPLILSGVSVSYNPYTGAMSVGAFPGLGPLYGLYYYSSYYGIDWKGLLQGRSSSSTVSVGYTFAPVDFNGKSFNGVIITITPTTSLFGTYGGYSISASLINLKGVPVATQLIVGTGGANYVSMSLLQVSVS
jgi:hypothetical protein